MLSSQQPRNCHSPAHTGIRQRCTVQVSGTLSARVQVQASRDHSSSPVSLSASPFRCAARPDMAMCRVPLSVYPVHCPWRFQPAFWINRTSKVGSFRHAIAQCRTPPVWMLTACSKVLLRLPARSFCPCPSDRQQPCQRWQGKGAKQRRAAAPARDGTANTPDMKRLLKNDLTGRLGYPAG